MLGWWRDSGIFLVIAIAVIILGCISTGHQQQGGPTHRDGSLGPPGSRMALSESRPEVGPPKITGKDWTLTRSVCTGRPRPDLPQIRGPPQDPQSEVGQIPDPHHTWYQLRSPLHIGGTQVRSTAQSEPPEDLRLTHRPKPLPLCLTAWLTISQQSESSHYNEILQTPPGFFRASGFLRGGVFRIFARAGTVVAVWSVSSASRLLACAGSGYDW